MSEYQDYEFRAIDRPLTDRQMRERLDQGFSTLAHPCSLSASLRRKTPQERGIFGTESALLPDWRHLFGGIQGLASPAVPVQQMLLRSVMLAATCIPMSLEKRRPSAYAALAMLPRPLLIAFATLGHRIMEARHLRGIQRRSTAAPAERRITGDEAWRKALLVCGVASSLLYSSLLYAAMIAEGGTS